MFKNVILKLELKFLMEVQAPIRFTGEGVGGAALFWGKTSIFGFKNFCT